jgi:hypothetical protein
VAERSVAPSPAAPNLREGDGSSREARSLQPASAPAAAAAQSDFSAYWRDLRAALLSDSPESVSRLARFPFTVRGEMDDDPVQQVDRAAFAAVVRRLLAQDVGLAPQPEPLSHYLARTPSPPANAIAGKTARVANMQFAWSPEGWQFVGAYLAANE